MLVIKGGHVLGVGVADVLVDGGVIAGVGAFETPEAIDARGLVVLPGFVDTHRHLVQAPMRGSGADLTLGAFLSEVLPRMVLTPAEVRAAVLLGAVEALNAGVTTVLDWGHGGAFEPEVEALREAGIRAVYGASPGDAPRFASSGLVTGAVASFGPALSFADNARDISVARSLGLTTTMHVTEAGAVARLADLLGPDLHFVHGNACTDEELRMLADAGCGLTATPPVESMMGHGAPVYGRFTAFGGTPALGVDVVINSAADMFEQMRAALWLERLRGSSLAAGALLGSATAAGARAIGLGDVVGSLEVGKRADIVLLDGFGHLPFDLVPGGIVATAGVADVRTVLVDGRVVKRDGVLVDHDLASLRAAVDDVARRVLA
ncbi:amidohydrolase family protein [Kutzneria kofuensis]|uniref:Cytosine/adenosine deaminase-related metal-dependent hydrolase n=1 Tax=Kutzneria kofuensis TaxID=103725 RepID=A0A7W9KPB4_9PSEU|nr:amidohydrolase family protein [Kutzneria kofuensis]MBB5895489.1 cytosine/adenosine deaminase-related metal-dependent hydrolase [Kutzneria kofuensis]